MADKYDNSIKTAMAQLQQLMISSRQQIANDDEFLSLKAQARDITQNMVDKIEQSSDDNPIYSRMGRAYVISTKEVELARQKKAVQCYNDDIKLLEGNKVLIGKKIVEAQDKMRAMLKNNK